ncbi:MAG: right-handed parallel beta-helix repeat-containing protein [Planctomycetes bacterium]|nr:right-handed parallel beta-helix repeat-containing protein [Planctomycetota bacterium]
MRNIIGAAVATICLAMIPGCDPSGGGKGMVVQTPETAEPAGLRDSAENIQSLIDQTPDGKTLEIPLGRYKLDKGLVILGKKGLKIVFAPGSRIIISDPAQTALTIRESSNIRIENAFIKQASPAKSGGNGVSGGPAAAVRLEKADSVSLINCEICGGHDAGIMAANSHKIEVRNCFIHHNAAAAFRIQECDRIKIADNLIENNGAAFQLDAVNKVDMYNNTTSRNGGYNGEPLNDSPGLGR